MNKASNGFTCKWFRFCVWEQKIFIFKSCIWESIHILYSLYGVNLYLYFAFQKLKYVQCLGLESILIISDAKGCSEYSTLSRKKKKILGFYWLCCFIFVFEYEFKLPKEMRCVKQDFKHSLLKTQGMIISASFSFQQQHMQWQLCTGAWRPGTLWNPRRKL